MTTFNSVTSSTKSSRTTILSFVQDPLEQFEVTPVFSLLCFVLNNLDITLRAVRLLLAHSLLSYNGNTEKVSSFGTKTVYSLVKSIVQEQLEIKKQSHFLVLFFLFSLLFVSNVLGLIPFTFTITSSFVFALFLALAHFIGANLIGASRHGWAYVNLFLPAGAPEAIKSFLIVIEVISYYARILSLSIRLFANRRSGHALLKILIGFALNRAASASLVLIFVSTLPWIIVTLVRFLELLIAFLQAYVFVILTSLYLNDNVHHSH